MAIEITIPRLGWSMDEGVFAGWLKRDGEPVRPGDPLFGLEGEKTTQDVEAIDGGTLRIPPTAPAAGDTVAVGAVIGYLIQADESAPPDLATTAGIAIQDPGPAKGCPAPLAKGPERPRSSPLARRIARE